MGERRCLLLGWIDCFSSYPVMGLSCKINPLFTFRLLNLNLSVQRKFIVLAYFFYTLVKFIYNQFPFINYTPSAGLVKSLEKIKQTDVVLYLFDVNITDMNALEIINKDLSHQNKKFILIGNKSEHCCIFYI